MSGGSLILPVHGEGDHDAKRHGGGAVASDGAPWGNRPSTTAPSGAAVPLPMDGEELRGSLVPDASLADFTWFRTGGPAEWLLRPADVADLAALMRSLDPAVPVMPIGVGSNLIVRDGGVPGVVVRLPKAMARVSVEGGRIRAGGAAMGITVASAARDAGVAGLEFLRGIPGTVGGAVRMNAGAYGRDTSDILREVTVVTRSGDIETWPAARLGYSYRHSELPEGAVVVEAVFAGSPGDPAVIGAEMDRIAAEREATQPLRSRTGGSTFKNPPGHKAWALIDAAGCRGLRNGDAQVSEKHCNFLLNLGRASATEIEALGEDVRARVLAHSGVTLDWEIQRVGNPLPAGERVHQVNSVPRCSGHAGGMTDQMQPRSGQGEGTVGRGKTPYDLLSRSRQLRADQTEAEARLWSRLRAARLNGMKFRRQAPLGRYIVDFLCSSEKLVVELDGSQHVEQASYDAERTRFLEGEGYRVVRVWNNDVLARTDAVLEAILAAAAPHPGAARLSLSPEGRGT